MHAVLIIPGSKVNISFTRISNSAAALQSFSDGYKFIEESNRHIAMQIGNAVPVRLGEQIGTHILMNS